jgi:hypothetical protein
MAKIESDGCKRRRIEIGGENFYLVVGQNFVVCTVPHENRPENLQVRQIVETICETITDMQGGGE